MNLTIAQSYLLCALTERGKLPVLNNDVQVCLVAGGLLDLLMEGSIGFNEKKKLYVKGDGITQHSDLKSLCDYIRNAKKPMGVKRLASDYVFTFSARRLTQLLEDIGCSLATMNFVENEGNRRFLPKAAAVDHVIQSIRAELLEEGTVSDEMVALVSLMDKSGQLKRYFSKYEKDQLKVRLKEIKESASHSLVKEMVDYIDLLMAAAASSAASC
ncbi:MAG: GPP34 family phosphoprotein [Bacillota bacterium]|nr:GPP34 family phosphoprotein [Bacillota bacterium]